VGARSSAARAAPTFVDRLRFLMGFLVATVAPPNVMPLPTGAADDDERAGTVGSGVGPRPVLDFSGSEPLADDMKLKDEEGAFITGSGAGGTGVCKKPKPLLAPDDDSTVAGAVAPPIKENADDCSGAGSGAAVGAPFPMNEKPEDASAAGAGAAPPMNEKPDAAAGFSSLSFDDLSFTSNPPNMTQDDNDITNQSKRSFAAQQQTIP